MQHNVLAMSGRAVEAAGDVDALLLDKTGTITLGNRQATEFMPGARASTERELADAAQLASLADETPEGRCIVVLAKEKYGIRERDMAELGAHFVPVHRPDAHERRRPRRPRRSARARSTPSIAYVARAAAAALPAERAARCVEQHRASSGGTPLVVADGAQRARRHPAQGHRQGRHPRALRRAAPHGHPHGDDHRRQPADRRGHRRRGRRRRLPRRGDARGQAAS